MATIIKPCRCLNEFQDRTYGRGMRVHNSYAKGWRCTVCLDEKPA